MFMSFPLGRLVGVVLICSSPAWGFSGGSLGLLYHGHQASSVTRRREPGCDVYRRSLRWGAAPNAAVGMSMSSPPTNKVIDPNTVDFWGVQKGLLIVDACNVGFQLGTKDAGGTEIPVILQVKGKEGRTDLLPAVGALLKELAVQNVLEMKFVFDGKTQVAAPPERILYF